MSSTALDLSFERQGRALSEWLWDLVADDRATRQQAAEAIGGIWRGYPRYSSEHVLLDDDDVRLVERRAEQFGAAVRAAVSAPGFATAQFVRKLCFLRIAIQEDWETQCCARSDKDHKVEDLQERLMQRFAESNDDAERAHLAKRFCRLFCASLERSNRKTAQAEAMSASGMMVSIVFDALDSALLEDKAGLRAILRANSIRYCALEAIARIGPPAREFAGSLLETLDTPEEHGYFDGAKALAAIARDDRYLVDELFRRLKQGDDGLKGRTASVFYHLGPNLAGRLEEVLAFLLEETRHRGDLLVSLTATLGSVGRDRPEALARLLELAASRPPRLRSLPEFPEHPYDEVMYERGAAIDALAFFPSFARRVVPVLVDAFDSFVEYDPDYCYGGERVRVCYALEEFGTAALPVVPTLVKYLDAWLTRSEDDRTWPGDVFRVLERIGPEARAALPALWKMRASRDDMEGEPLDRSDSLDQAILAIQDGRV